MPRVAICPLRLKLDRLITIQCATAISPALRDALVQVMASGQEGVSAVRRLRQLLPASPASPRRCRTPARGRELSDKSGALVRRAIGHKSPNAPTSSARSIASRVSRRLAASGCNEGVPSPRIPCEIASLFILRAWPGS